MSVPATLTAAMLLAAEKDPDAPFFALGGADPAEVLSAASFSRRSLQLAALLVSLGVQPGDRVALWLDKSLESALGLHGVLAAGAAYVPIDPRAPIERVGEILVDCGVELAIIGARQAPGAATLGPTTPLRAVVGAEADGLVSSTWAAVDTQDPLVGPVRAVTDDLAYVMYTSGSTGTPKGIMHTHRSGLAYVERAVHTYGLGPGDRLASLTPLHFDMSTFEFLAGPAAGSCTVVIPEPYLALPASLSELLASERVTTVYSVPFAFIQLIERGDLDRRDLSTIRWVLFGGEPFTPHQLAAVMAALPGARFSNSYGPAEVNQCTFHHLDQPPTDTVPIGAPWADTEVELLDGDRVVIGPGQGELIVRTPTMMSGYWNRPDLSSDKFIDRPVAGGRVERWYRTGDLVERTSGDDLAFSGRVDRQVKVRGHRVELEEVEAALTAVPAVHHAVAFLVDDRNGSHLGAVVVGERPEPRVVIRAVARTLPSYAIPTVVDVWTELPLTGSGKVDRRTVAERARARHETNNTESGRL